MPCVITRELLDDIGGQRSIQLKLAEGRHFGRHYLTVVRPISILDGNIMKYPLKRVGRCPRLDFFHISLESMIVAGSVVIFPFWLGDMLGIR